MFYLLIQISPNGLKINWFGLDFFLENRPKLSRSNLIELDHRFDHIYFNYLIFKVILV